MKSIDWYFDFISPFSYLQLESFHRLPEDIEVQFKPVLLAGLLEHWGTKGPVEIPPKRRFTYRHIQWLARHHGIPFRMPPAHPFNPLKALRLAIALGNRPVAVEEIFRFIWRDGQSIDDTTAWAGLIDRFDPEDFDADVNDTEVKRALRHHTEQAAKLGVFGVPTFIVDKELFWGFDATDMLLDYLKNPSLFQDPEMVRISNLPEGVQRKV